MNISLLISGNLTGFGRFYTSPAASELLGSEKISFDNHSFLPFLGNDEKAYSITFTKRLIAISQYTQILDSFRRPGKLVISLLIPRNYTIVPNSGSPKGAVYSLLTKISDRFFEKNFLDGMINQNLAVLGQDYYSEILESYTLKPIDCRRINEDPVPMKKVGYVRASESDMPSYLDTPYRKSYGEGGFNLILFAPSAPVGTPNSIDEEPEEAVWYKVKILNTGAILPNPVKLSTPLYKLQAKAGEKQFPIEGTYNDVIEHLLEPRITGRIMPGETIEIQYNFEKEEKTVKLVFVDISTSTPVNLDTVLPSIVFSDGSRQPISSDTFTFRGSEIYDDKKIIAENTTFSISSRSERLDLSRLSNGQEHKIYVQQRFSLPVYQSLMSLTISFANKNTGQVLSFSNQSMIHLSGKASDWNVFVDTEHYVAPVQPLIIHSNGNWAINNLQQKRKNDIGKSDFPIKPSGTAIAIQAKSPISPQQSRSGSSDEFPSSSKKSNKKLKWHKYLVLILISLGIIGSGWWIYKKNLNQPIVQDNVDEDEDEENVQQQGCYLIYFDNTEDERKRDTITSKNSNRFSYKLIDRDGSVLNNYMDTIWLYQNHKEILIHKISLIDYEKDISDLTMEVSYIVEGDTLQIVNHVIPKLSIDRFDTINVNLGIRLSQLQWYDDMCRPNFKFKNEQAKINKLKEITELKDSKFSRKLLTLANSKDCSSSVPTLPPAPPSTPTDDIPDLLNGNSWQTASELKEQYKKGKVKSIVYNRAQAMANALDQVKSLKKAKTNGLSQIQQETIKKYNKALQNDKYKKMLQGAQQRGQLTSFKQIWDLVETW